MKYLAMLLFLASCQPAFADDCDFANPLCVVGGDGVRHLLPGGSTNPDALTLTIFVNVDQMQPCASGAYKALCLTVSHFAFDPRYPYADLKPHNANVATVKITSGKSVRDEILAKVRGEYSTLDWNVVLQLVTD